MTVVGIDYSMTSPAVCICDGKFEYANCAFLYVTGNKKLEGKINNQITGSPLYEYKDNIERFEKLANAVTDFIGDRDDVVIGLEGYAMGAKGQVFNIGENTGILKYILSKKNFPVEIYAPSAIKKFATGKGNANKEAMFEAFLAETGVNLFDEFGIEQKEKIGSPISDIVDAYYIAKLRSES